MTPTESYRIPVKGMSCQHCVARVKTAVERLAGARVDAISVGEVSVAIDPQRASRQEVLAAIRSAGYSAE
jgi:copper chaperone CopZ